MSAHNATVQRGCEQQMQLSHQVPLFHPGLILHIVKTREEYEGWFGKVRDHYELLDPNEQRQQGLETLDYYTEIAVSRTMVHDHQIGHYYAVLRSLLYSYYSRSD